MSGPSAPESLTSRGANKTPREVILRRSSKWSFANQKWREAKSGVFYFLLAGFGLAIGLFMTAGLHIPGGIVCGMLIGLAAIAPIWWYVEFRRTPRKRRERQLATVDAVRRKLPVITFNDGSTERFEPTDVLRSDTNIVIAIDVDRMLARLISNAEWPDEGIDWVHELPDNTDVDVANYPRRLNKGKKVPSLVFSSEDENGFQVTSFALAPECIASARALVAQLKRRRSQTDWSPGLCAQSSADKWGMLCGWILSDRCKAPSPRQCRVRGKTERSQSYLMKHHPEPLAA